VTRVSNVGCLAVDGPRSTAPSLSLKVDPCQDHEVGEPAGRPVECLRALDALCHCHRLGGAQRSPRRPQRLVTGE
jgi:hypothetical protein